MSRLVAIGLAALALTNAVTAFAACTLGVTDVSFGDYDVFSPLDTDIAGSISVTNRATSVSISSS